MNIIGGLGIDLCGWCSWCWGWALSLILDWLIPLLHYFICPILPVFSRGLSPSCCFNWWVSIHTIPTIIQILSRVLIGFNSLVHTHIIFLSLMTETGGLDFRLYFLYRDLCSLSETCFSLICKIKLRELLCATKVVVLIFMRVIQFIILLRFLILNFAYGLCHLETISSSGIIRFLSLRGFFSGFWSVEENIDFLE